MKEIQAAVRPDNVVFVMDATQGQAVFDQVRPSWGWEVDWELCVYSVRPRTEACRTLTKSPQPPSHRP